MIPRLILVLGILIFCYRVESFLDNTLPLYLFKNLDDRDGKETTTSLVTVRRVPPYFSYKLERQYVVGIGGNINLTCVAVGYPMPRVFWKKTDQQVLDDPSAAPIGKNVLTLTNVEATENFTCVAVSALGNIEATTNVIAKELPPPPTNVIVSSVTSESVVISWKPPKYDEAITKYVVKYRLKSNSNGFDETNDETDDEADGNKNRYAEGRSSRGKTLETLETTIVIDGLIAFQTYEFVVRSVGPVGAGAESLPIEAQTMTSKPTSPPVNAQARSLSRESILVKWGPCEHPNGVVSGYKIFYTNDLVTTPLQQWKIHETKADEFVTTIYGLEPDSRYFIKIVAQNAEGDSPPSTLVTVSTRQGIPGQPPMLSSKALDSRRMQLTWDKPLFSSPIVGYTIRYNTTDGEKELTLTSPHEKHIVTGLHPDKHYYFRIAAYSERGQGEFTESIIAKTIASIPLSAPTITSINPTSSKNVEVKWNGPEEKKTNGILTAYRIRFRKIEEAKALTDLEELAEYSDEEEIGDRDRFEDVHSIVVSSNSGSAILSDLLPYSTYEVTVAASTVDGYGPESAIRVVKTLEDG